MRLGLGGDVFELKQIAALMGISVPRVAQIESKAYRRLRSLVHRQILREGVDMDDLWP